jgi:hypothetical protein
MTKKSFSYPLITVLFFLALASGISSCSKKCKDEQPRARIENNGTAKADVQIKTSGGNTENINNVYPGQLSEWRSFAPGHLEFTVAVQGSTPAIIMVDMINCWEYNIIIDSANNLSTLPVEREKI